MPLPHMYQQRTEEHFRNNRHPNPILAVIFTTVSMLVGAGVALFILFVQ